MLYVDGKKAIASAEVFNKHRKSRYGVAVVNSRMHRGFDALIIPMEWADGGDHLRSGDAIASSNGHADISSALIAGKHEAQRKW